MNANSSTAEVIAFPVEETKVCTKCRTTKPVSAFYVSRTRNCLIAQCKDCTNERTAAYNRRNKDKIKVWTKNRIANNPHYKRNDLYKGKYGMTFEQVKSMLDSQFGLCANRACGKELDLYGLGKQNQAYVDHNHQTGKVRGILCNTCNVALGYLEQKNRVLGLTEYLQHTDK